MMAFPESVKFDEEFSCFLIISRYSPNKFLKGMRWESKWGEGRGYCIER